jgi:hypothetical protein
MGLIIKPKNFFSWDKSHCMIPTPVHLGGDIYRIFFGTRNNKNQSSVTYADINLAEKITVLKYSQMQALKKGKVGAFDDNGVLPSCVIKKKTSFFLYYIGWQPRVTTRYSLVAGLAISKKGKIFKRYSESPILNTNKKEPYSILTAPFVIKVRTAKWFMWYVSCKYWKKKDLPIYDVKYSISKDGLNWIQTGRTCINLKKNERAIARPYVIYKNKVFRMWYSYEKKVGTYKIGYAESKDGIKWKRKDNKIIFYNKKSSKTDSQMKEYSAIIEHKSRFYMFYNGNNYGKFGIELAQLTK